MNIMVIGVIGIVVFAIIGYLRGMFRIVAAFISFFLAAIFAKTFSLLVLWPVGKIGVIPKSLVPLAGQIFAGIILFLLFNYGAGCFIRMREHSREKSRKSRMATWESIGGALFGTAWGLFLVVFILAGFHLIGNVEEALVQPSRSFLSDSKKVSSVLKEMEADLRPNPPQSKFVKVKNQIETSPFGPIVKKVDPMDERIKEIFQNLTIVVSDSLLYKDFIHHPDIARFTQDPRILALSRDEEIQRQLEEKQYYELLDNEKIASLLKEKDLIAELKNIDLGEVLKEVIEKNPGRVE